MRKLIFLIVLCLLVGPVFAAKKRKPIELEIPSYDGFKMVGTLDIPNKTTVKKKAPLVVFLHSVYKSQRTWRDLPQKVKEDLNTATLNLDLRGHGQSTLSGNNKKVHATNLAQSSYQKMPEDIIEVLKYIKNEYPELDCDRVAIVGSSLGATVGLMAASYKEENPIKTVIMLSPMLEYKGFDLRLPIVKYGKHPLLILTSKKDKYSYESSTELIKFAQDKKLLKVYPSGGHGEDLLRFQPDSKEVIINWLQDSLQQKKKDKKKANEKQPPYKKINKYSGKIKIH